ncbi:MAG: response regulator [Acidimicrobiia bacterium]
MGGNDGLRVLVIDERTERRHLFRNLVESTGLAAADIAEAAGAAEALELFGAQDPDVVFVEIQPVSEGLETVLAVRHRSSAVRIVVCSFHRDPRTKEQALAQGADVYLDKPVSSYALTNVLLGFFPEASAVRDVSLADESASLEPPVPMVPGPVGPPS